SGSLFWDDGDSLDTIENKTYNYFEFNVTSLNILTINALVTNDKDSSMVLGTVKVLGLHKSVTNVNVNRKPYSTFVYNVPDAILIIYALDLNLLSQTSQTIQWTTAN
ncbi:unnamed protein product, partial [Adineta steineri]